MSVHDLPAVNASLNGVAAILLMMGWFFIRQKNIPAHRFCMVAAFLMSALFLGCYLTYHYFAGSKLFPGTGLWKTIYLSILVPHIILAVVMLPMILRVFYLAFKGDFARHKPLARITLPIWIYVSITGVLVYVMLYRMDWGVAA
jgi:uncharacterized membrane protein YozB (DUF420 family)